MYRCKELMMMMTDANAGMSNPISEAEYADEAARS
jgi:hypothetical protein